MDICTGQPTNLDKSTTLVNRGVVLLYPVLKFCQVAEGLADVYPRFSRTMEWDTAAGDAVLRAAGGKTLTLDHQPLIYGKRNQQTDCDYANPFFIAYGGSEPA